jgi:hypothetical protein
MMTHEDIMRELELLPIWRLRAPSFSKEIVALPESAQVKSEIVKPTDLIVESIVDEVEVQEIVAETKELGAKTSLEVLSEPQEFTLILSDDGDWLFIMPSVLMLSDELQLFQNICRSLRIKTKPAQTSNNILLSISDMPTKLLLVMGVVTVQTILQTAEPINNLYGKKHQLNGIDLIATYDLAHLLKKPLDKSKVWKDLCMGLQILQELKVENS